MVGRGRTNAAVAAGQCFPCRKPRAAAKRPPAIVNEIPVETWQRATQGDTSHLRDEPSDVLLEDILKRASAMRHLVAFKKCGMASRSLKSGKITVDILFSIVHDYTVASDILCAAEDTAWRVPQSMSTSASSTDRSVGRIPSVQSFPCVQIDVGLCVNR